MNDNKFRTILFVGGVFVLAGFLLFGGQVIETTKAWMMIYSYIRDLNIAPSPFDPSGDSDVAAGEDFWNPSQIAKMTISYYQEQNGYVCIIAYPYDPEHTDPEYPQYPYEFTDYDHPINIYFSLMEMAGQKTVDWSGMDPEGNIVEEGLYMLEAAIYSAPGCQMQSMISDCAESLPFEIKYHLSQ